MPTLAMEEVKLWEPLSSSPPPTAIDASPGTPRTPLKYAKLPNSFASSPGKATVPTGLLGVAELPSASLSSIPQPAKSYSLGVTGLRAGSNVVAYESLAETFYVSTSNTISTSSTNYLVYSASNTTSSSVSALTINWNVYITYPVGQGIQGGGNWLPPPQVFTPEVLARAHKLLVHLLSSKQRRMWMRVGFILIPSASRPGVVYRISRETSLIREYREGYPVRDLCVHPNDVHLPLGDRIATLKLLVEAEEADLLATAIEHKVAVPAGYRPGRHSVPLVKAA